MESNSGNLDSMVEPLLSEDTQFYTNDETVYQPVATDDKNLLAPIKNFYDKCHGSSTRIPGGNCVFESVLSYMDENQIQNMIDTVENFIAIAKNRSDNGETKFKNILTDIKKIFANTPNSKYADLSAYMRIYIYIHYKIKLEKKFSRITVEDSYNSSEGFFTKVDKINKDNAPTLNALTSGSHIIPNGYIWSILRKLTGRDILILNTEKFLPVLVTKENNKINYVNQVDDHYNLNDISAYFAAIKTGLTDNKTATVCSEKNTICLFFSGAHCTPAVPENKKSLGTQIDCTKLNMNFRASKPQSPLKFTFSTLVLIGGGIGGLFFWPLLGLCVPGAAGFVSSFKDIKDNTTKEKQNTAAFAAAKAQAPTSHSQTNNKYGHRPLKQELLKCEQKAKQQSNTFFQTNQTPENSL